MKKLKVGLLGMGRIGRLHGDNITYFVKNAEIIAAADPMLNSTMEEWAAELGIPKVYSDPMKVVQDPEVEAVFICTSTPAHAELSIAAAKAGKHIFCEKPVHTDLNEIRKILAEVEKAGVKFQVGFVRRFDHNHRAVYEAVRAGKVGKVNLVKICSRDPEPPAIDYVKASGGVLVDPAIGEAGNVDTAVVSLKFANGAMGVIDNSRKAVYGYDQRVEVFGSEGAVMDENDTPHNAT